MIKNIINSALCAFIALGLGSCNKSSGDEPIGGTAFTDIVTVASTGNEGTVFTFRAINDSPEITLTTTQRFTDTSVKDDTRVCITYIPESGKQYESGVVNVLNYFPCYGPTITIGTTPGDWSSSAIYLTGLWRSGNWLNMQMVLNVTNSARRFALVLDEATADSSMPELHIAFSADLPSTAFAQPSFASFNIAELWNNPEVEGLKIFFYTSDGQENCATLTKSASEFKPAE